MRFTIISFVTTLLLTGCEEPPASEQGQENPAHVDSTASYFTAEQIDSMVDMRLDYFIGLFGDTSNFEQYYERTVEDIREEYIQIYTDSLGQP